MPRTACVFLIAVAAVATVTLAPSGALAAADNGVENAKPLPPPALEAMRRALHQIGALVPAAERPYAPGREGHTVDATGSWDPKTKTWLRPMQGSSVVSYAVPNDAPDVSAEMRALLFPIETHVVLNGELRFADLASEGGSPSLFPVRDGTAVEVSVISAGSAQGRVAALTPRQAEYRLTALPPLIGDPAPEA